MCVCNHLLNTHRWTVIDSDEERVDRNETSVNLLQLVDKRVQRRKIGISFETEYDYISKCIYYIYKCASSVILC